MIAEKPAEGQRNLIHTAVGWMLREVGKMDMAVWWSTCASIVG
jgi:3-methyladenine DNA glycosylase AlkD